MHRPCGNAAFGAVLVASLCWPRGIPRNRAQPGQCAAHMAAPAQPRSAAKGPESPPRRAAGAAVLVGLGFVVSPRSQHSEAASTAPKAALPHGRCKWAPLGTRRPVGPLPMQGSRQKGPRCCCTRHVQCACACVPLKAVRVCACTKAPTCTSGGAVGQCEVHTCPRASHIYERAEQGRGAIALGVCIACLCSPCGGAFHACTASRADRS